jgi:hypothetical protein
MTYQEKNTKAQKLAPEEILNFAGSFYMRQTLRKRPISVFSGFPPTG